MSVYSQRYWQGEPTTGEGIVHAVYDLNHSAVTACGVYFDGRSIGMFRTSNDRFVTCLRCVVTEVRRAFVHLP